MESLAKAECVAFDKTGTLTKGSFEVTDVRGAAEMLELAAHAEHFSNHPIAASLKRAYGKNVDGARVGSVVEISGKGVIASVDGRDIAVGNEKLMRHAGVECREAYCGAGTIAHVAADGAYLGYIVIADELKPQAKEALKALKDCGVRYSVMLTGDRKEAAVEIASRLHIDRVYSELLPDEKVSRLEKLLEEKGEGTLVYAGDGVNDAPVLSRADVGIAMGALGSDAAIEAADVVLMDDNPAKIAAAIRISQKTIAIVRQNIIFALGVKALVLILSALGYANMWAAVFADVGVSILAILNAMRALKFRE